VCGGGKRGWKIPGGRMLVFFGAWGGGGGGSNQHGSEFFSYKAGDFWWYKISFIWICHYHLNSAPYLDILAHDIWIMANIWIMELIFWILVSKSQNYIFWRVEGGAGSGNLQEVLSSVSGKNVSPTTCETQLSLHSGKYFCTRVFFSNQIWNLEDICWVPKKYSLLHFEWHFLILESQWMI